MHDVAKTKVGMKRNKLGGLMRWTVYALVVAMAVAAFIFLHLPMMLIVILSFSALMIWFGFIAFRRFRSGRTTSAAIFAVLAVFFLLLDLKALQFQTMGAAAKKMAPPPTTVTSAVVIWFGFIAFRRFRSG